MEWAFLFMVIVAPVLLVGVLGIVIYNQDPKGWRRTLKRGSDTARAYVGHKKDPLPIEASKTEEEAKKDWEAKFENKPREIEKPAVKLKHEIVKTDYYMTQLGPWPQWHCKCGQKGHEVVASYSLEHYEKKAIQSGQEHCDRFNKAEAKLQQSGGKFSF